MSAASLKRKATDLASAAKKPKADKSITSFFSAPPSSSSSAAPHKKKNPLSESDALIALAEEEDDSAAAAPSKSQAPLASSATLAALPKFDKDKWVAKLTPEQKELLSLEIETLDESWLAQLKDEVLTKEFLDLKRFLKAEKDAGQKVFPPEKEIYSWFVLPFFCFLKNLRKLLSFSNLDCALLFIHCPFQYYSPTQI